MSEGYSKRRTLQLKIAIEALVYYAKSVDNAIAMKALDDIESLYISKNRGDKKNNKNPRLDEGLLWCSKCKKYYPKEKFCKDVSKGTGYQGICKECNKKQAKERRGTI